MSLWSNVEFFLNYFYLFLLIYVIHERSFVINNYTLKNKTKQYFFNYFRFPLQCYKFEGRLYHCFLPPGVCWENAANLLSKDWSQLIQSIAWESWNKLSISRKLRRVTYSISRSEARAGDPLSTQLHVYFTFHFIPLPSTVTSTNICAERKTLQTFYLSVCLSVFVCLSVCLCLSVFVCLSVWLINIH